MQSSTGQYSTHAGDPAQPVQHSVITASSFGFFFRGVVRPLDFGSNLSSSGTIPTAFGAPGAAGMSGIIAQKTTVAVAPLGSDLLRQGGNAPFLFKFSFHLKTNRAAIWRPSCWKPDA